MLGMVLLVAVACRPTDPAPPPPTDEPSSPAAHSAELAHSGVPQHSARPAGHSGSTADTGGPAHSGGPGVDCSAVPRPPLASSHLTRVVIHEDFAFDDVGNLVAHAGSSFVKQGYPPSPFYPFAPTSGGGGGPASIRRLPSGDFVYVNVDTSSLYRIDGASGAEIFVKSGFAYANGIEVHRDGQVYVADLAANRVALVDPYTGQGGWILQDLPSPNGLTLSPDYGTLYVGTTRDGLFAVPVDPAGVPTGPPVPWAASPDGELLGLGADACGNVYAAAGGGTSVWRFPADGAAPERLADGGRWFTNLQWGSGVGGWREDVLYVNDRGSWRYLALEVGVPGKPR